MSNPTKNPEVESIKNSDGDIQVETATNFNDNSIDNLNALEFQTGGVTPRAMYAGSSGLFVKRSYGEAATLTKQWSPPESQGGKESTLALVVGDDDAYVYDVYNNSGYSSGDRAARWGVSLKHQNSASARPYIIDFDNSALGGNSHVPRLAINPQGDFEHRNGPVNFNENPAYGLREVGPNPSASDLNLREWAFTTDVDGNGNAAWLYKDSTGTLNIHDSDAGNGKNVTETDATFQNFMDLEPTTSPSAPSNTDEVRVYNDGSAIKAKFDDGSVKTIVTK